MSRTVGIDLGTTYSLIAYQDRREGRQLKGANQKRVAMRADGTVASSEGKTPIDRNE